MHKFVQSAPKPRQYSIYIKEVAELVVPKDFKPLIQLV